MEWMLGFPIINLCKKLLFLWFSLDIKRAVYDRRNLRNCHDMILIFNVLTDMYVYIYKENQTKNWLKWYDWTWTFDLVFKYIFYVLNNFYMSRYHYITTYIFSALKKCKHLDKVYANVWAKIWNIYILSIGLHVHMLKVNRSSTAAGSMTRDIHYNVLIYFWIRRHAFNI